MKPQSSYDREPTIRVSENSSACHTGWSAVAGRLRAAIGSVGCKVVVAECYPGVILDEVRLGLGGLEWNAIICVEDALHSPAELMVLLEPFLGTDPVFGRMTAWQLSQFFDPVKVAMLRSEIAQCEGNVLLYGAGAAYVAEQCDFLLYCDVARWEIQQRQRVHRSGNLGAHNESATAAELYKRSYFVDWRMADTERHRLYGSIDWFLDTNLADEPVMVSGQEYRAALALVSMQPFRVVPFFDPGPWGGQWMREHFDLPSGPKNFAWCFDCVPEENSIRLRFGANVLEVPALTLVHEHPKALLGDEIVRRFGAEFPIRFDFLDTMDGGNLSLQVHPLRSYIAEHFGMAYTQDESYYLMDADADAEVYLGLKDGIDAAAMTSALKAAQTGGPPFPVEKYVTAWPVQKHSHVSIPAGTIHCSGRNSMVLEISATPYIFTFKLWDWNRLGMDGKPRPIHLEHGMNNIQWDRDKTWVANNLVNQTRTVAQGDGWREEATGLHALEFIETRRHWFTKPVLHDTLGTVHVLNLVEGDEVVVDSPEHRFEPFVVHYAETFIVPASVGPYRISPTGETSSPLATIKAYVRTDGASSL